VDLLRCVHEKEVARLGRYVIGPELHGNSAHSSSGRNNALWHVAAAGPISARSSPLRCCPAFDAPPRVYDSGDVGSLFRAFGSPMRRVSILLLLLVVLAYAAAISLDHRRAPDPGPRTFFARWSPACADAAEPAA